MALKSRIRPNLRSNLIRKVEFDSRIWTLKFKKSRFELIGTNSSELENNGFFPRKRILWVTKTFGWNWFNQFTYNRHFLECNISDRELCQNDSLICSFIPVTISSNWTSKSYEPVRSYQFWQETINMILILSWQGTPKAEVANLCFVRGP